LELASPWPFSSPSNLPRRLFRDLPRKDTERDSDHEHVAIARGDGVRGMDAKGMLVKPDSRRPIG